MRRKAEQPARRQLTPDELLGRCLAFLQRKFYQGQDRAYSKDRQRLLKWVVLWPAKWLDERAVSIPPDQYYDTFISVFQDALNFGDLENITYLPAWLAKVIQSHFDHHGDDIYQRAKSLRTLCDAAQKSLTNLPRRAPDTVRELASASRLIRPRNHGKRKVVSAPKKEQLNLL